MSAHEELDPMSGLAARALAAERDHLPRDAARAERLFSRVVVTVGAVAVATGSAAAAGSAAAGSSAGAPLASGAKVAGATMTAKAAVGLAALAFALGTGAGVALERNRSPEHAAPRSEPSSSAGSSAAPVPEVPASVLPPLPASAATPPSASVATSRPSSSPAPVPPEATATTQDQKDAELAAERALVDRARSALGRGDTAASLEAVAAHETRFPRGRLTEERELVAIQTLVRRGDGAAAKARADRFRKTHPKSVFLPAIDRLVPP